MCFRQQTMTTSHINAKHSPFSTLQCYRPYVNTEGCYSADWLCNWPLDGGTFAYSEWKAAACPTKSLLAFTSYAHSPWKTYWMSHATWISSVASPVQVQCRWLARGGHQALGQLIPKQVRWVSSRHHSWESEWGPVTQGGWTQELAILCGFLTKPGTSVAQPCASWGCREPGTVTTQGQPGFVKK